MNFAPPQEEKSLAKKTTKKAKKANKKRKKKYKQLSTEIAVNKLTNY